MKHPANVDPPILDIMKKYIPIDDCGYDNSKIMNLIKLGIVDYAEFKKPGAKRRSIHVNIDDILRYIESNGGHM